MSKMTMKDLCEYSSKQRKLRAAVHRREHHHDGLCSGLTQSEYNRMTVRQKTSFSKARKFTHNRMWKSTHTKFDLKQLKLISKS